MKDKPDGEPQLKPDRQLKRAIKKQLDKYAAIHREVEAVADFYRRQHQDEQQQR